MTTRLMEGGTMMRIRFRLRTVMITVAIAALMLAAVSGESVRDWICWHVRYTILDQQLPRLITFAIGGLIVSAVPLVGLAIVPRAKRRWWCALTVPFVLAGIVVWMFWMARRSDAFSRRDLYHHSWSGEMIAVSLTDWRALRAHLSLVHAQSPARIAWQRAMYKKYATAARYPWLPVATDPSMPN